MCRVMFVILLVTPVVLPQDQTSYGLQFNSRNVERTERTIVNCTNNGLIHVEDKFTLEFDLSLWTKRYFGHVFFIHDAGKTFTVVHNHFLNPDTSYFQFIYWNEEKLSVPVPKSKFTRNNWLHVCVTMDMANDLLLVSFDGEKYQASVTMSDILKADLGFGTDSFTRTSYRETPAICLRNIEVKDKYGNLMHQWLLNETDGVIAKDSKGDLDAVIRNPNWLAQKHFHWEKLHNFQPEDYVFGLTQDSLNNRLLFLTEHYFLSFDMMNNVMDTIRFSEPCPMLPTQSSLLHDVYSNTIYGYHSGSGEVTIYNEEKNKWTDIYSKEDFKQHYYVHVPFLSPDRLPMFLSGYGWYRFHNELMSYDFRTKKWNEIPYDGDFFKPRYMTTLGNSCQENAYYLFGGQGNKDGKQELGVFHFFDFNMLDLNDTSMTHLWERKDLGSLSRLNNYLQFFNNDSVFYALGKSSLPNFTTSDYIKLAKFNTLTGDYVFVGDSLAMNVFEFERAPVYLFYNSPTKEFYAITAEIRKAAFHNYTIYSLRYPPISHDEMKQLNKLNPKIADTTFPFSMLYIPLGLGLLAFGFYYILRRKQNGSMVPSVVKSAKTKPISNGKNEKDTLEKPKRNAIYLFGEFTVFDKNGADISDSFSDRLKEMFLILLLHSYSPFHYTEQTGIKSQKISELMWQSVDGSSAKNNRNVTMNRLKGILKMLDGVFPQYDNGLWRIDFDDTLYIDYLELMKSFKNLKEAKKSNLTELYERILFVANGKPFLPNTEYEWLDSYKTEIADTIIKICEHILPILKDPKSLHILADNLLAFDPVNEIGFKLKIQLLHNEGKHNIIKTTYEKYIKEYKYLYAEEYPNTIQELLH